MHFLTERTAFAGPVVNHWLERKIAQTANGYTYMYVHTYNIHTLSNCLQHPFAMSGHLFNVNDSVSFD